MTLRVSRALAVFAMVSVAPAAVMFEFDYTGSTEFNDASQGAARRQALEDAASSLGALFDHSAVISLRVTSSNDPFGDTLAYASSEYGDVAPGFAGYTSGVVMKKVLTGTDDNGGALDGEVHVNFGLEWDLDDEVASSAYDFKATIIHELLHTLGFLSGVLRDGSDAYGNPPGQPGVWEIFDDFLTDKDGTPVIDDSTFALDAARWSALSVGGASPAGGLFFNGPRAMAANGGQPVGIFSPSSWSDGSSGSHLDDDNPALAGLLMLAATDTGQNRRTLSAIERGILQDLGFRLLPQGELRFEVVSVDPGVSVQLRLTGPAGWYAIERSTGLVTWDSVRTVEVTPAGVSVTIPIAETDKALFFRFGETTPPPESVQGRRASQKKWR